MKEPPKLRKQSMTSQRAQNITRDRKKSRDYIIKKSNRCSKKSNDIRKTQPKCKKQVRALNRKLKLSRLKQIEFGRILIWTCFMSLANY